MNDTEKILTAVQALSDRVSASMSAMEKRLNEHDQMIEKLVKQSIYQRKSISVLEQKIRELSETSAVWRSRDRSEVGIDCDAAYEAFRELGYSNRDALKHLDKAGILRRGGSHLTKPVRKGKKVFRAIVIMEDK